MCDAEQSIRYSEDVCDALDTYLRSGYAYILYEFFLFDLELIIVCVALFKLIKRGQFEGLPLNVKIIFIMLILYALMSISFCLYLILMDGGDKVEHFITI